MQALLLWQMWCGQHHLAEGPGALSEPSWVHGPGWQLISNRQETSLLMMFSCTSKPSSISSWPRSNTVLMQLCQQTAGQDWQLHDSRVQEASAHFPACLCCHPAQAPTTSHHRGGNCHGYCLLVPEQDFAPSPRAAEPGTATPAPKAALAMLSCAAEQHLGACFPLQY